MSADTTYQIDYAYNSLGALDTLTYPTSTSGYRLKLQYEYSSGALKRIKDFNAPSTVFWQANTANARGQITQEALGNGLVTNRAYDAAAGWLKSIQTGPGGGSSVQNLSYQWDKMANLTQRQDLNQSLTEALFYDNQYRLDYSTLNGSTNLDLSYDGLGNITFKSDVGNYTYHATKKHAVASTSNGWSFSYDANGNMQTGRGATITWTSYNYAASIVNGSYNASFYYGPNRNYWKQVAAYSDGTSTTIYVGSLLEKVTTASGTTVYRHMIRAGGATVIVSRDTAGANNTYYMTQDHLGSSSAVTNSSGAVLMQSSFAAYGARRGSNWSGTPSAADLNTIAYTTRRGFTDHTMLDNLGLIHMNGRVQDPVLGRFVSADPVIDGVGDTQGWNRYSYLQNRPFGGTDPSGFTRRRAQRDASGGDLDDLEFAMSQGHRYSPASVEGMEGTNAYYAYVVATVAAQRTANLVSQINSYASRSPENAQQVRDLLAARGISASQSTRIGLTVTAGRAGDGAAAIGPDGIQVITVVAATGANRVVRLAEAHGPRATAGSIYGHSRPATNVGSSSAGFTWTADGSGQDHRSVESMQERIASFAEFAMQHFSDSLYLKDNPWRDGQFEGLDKCNLFIADAVYYATGIMPMQSIVRDFMGMGRFDVHQVPITALGWSRGYAAIYGFGNVGSNWQRGDVLTTGMHTGIFVGYLPNGRPNVISVSTPRGGVLRNDRPQAFENATGWRYVGR